MKKTKSYPKTMRGLALILSLIMVLTSCDLSAVSVMASTLDAETEDILVDNTSDESKDSDPEISEASKEEPGALIPETEAEPEETPASDKDNSVTENIVPFAKSVTVDDVVVTVMADEGVFPADSQLFVKRVTDRNTQKKIDEAVEKEHETGIRVAASYTFDIKVLDKVGNEIEPDNTAGKVQLSFATAEVSNENLTADIYHIKTEEESSASDDADKNREAHGEIKSSDEYEAERLDSATLSTDELNKQADEIAESLQNAQEHGVGGDASTKEELAANDATEVVQAETDGFSYYTVEFTYHERLYVMQGDSEVLLQDILDQVGIVGEVTDAVGSNDALFMPEKRDGVWYVKALQAFSTVEWLKVTVNGAEIEITVTDWADMHGYEHPMLQGLVTNLCASLVFEEDIISFLALIESVTFHFNVAGKEYTAKPHKIDDSTMHMYELVQETVGSYVYCDWKITKVETHEIFSTKFINDIWVVPADATLKYSINAPEGEYELLSGSLEERTTPPDRDNSTVLPKVRRAGYFFDGWYDKNDNKIGDGGEAYVITHSETLSAHWTQIPNTAVINLKKDDAAWSGQDVGLYKDGILVYTLEEANGVYSSNKVVNGAYDIYVNEQKSDRSITFNAEYTSLKTTVDVDYQTLVLNVYVDNALSTKAGPVTLREGGRIIYIPESSDGIYKEVVLKSEPSYNVFVNGMDTGAVLSQNGKNADLNFYTVKLTVHDDAPWENADVKLCDVHGNQLGSLEYASASSNTTYYERIIQKDEATTYYIHVGEINTGATVKATTADKNAELTFYTATARVNCSDENAHPRITADNGVDRYEAFYKSANGATQTYEAPHVFIRADGENEMAYKIQLSPVSTAGATVKSFISTDKVQSFDLCLVKYYAYSFEESDRTLKHPIKTVKSTHYVLKGCKDTPAQDEYVDGFSFDGWSTGEWSPTEASYTAFDFGSAVTSDINLYPHFMKPAVRINGYVRTDVNGIKTADGQYFRLANLSIGGFEKGETIKYVLFDVREFGSVSTTSGLSSYGGTFDDANYILTFTSPVTMAVAQKAVRECFVFTPRNGENKVAVTVMDKNGNQAFDDGIGTPAASSTGWTSLNGLSAGAELAAGNFYVPSNKSFDNSGTAGANGLKIKTDATVTILIPAGVTLTCKGGPGSGQYTGGGAGILVPKGATLNIIGHGTIISYGGNAAKGVDGGKGNGVIDSGGNLTAGSGGNGGGGGAGAGAGIGTNGGTGGNGGAGGAAPTSWGYLSNANLSVEGNAGADGGSGSSALACGGVNFASTVTKDVQGGSAASGGNGGAASNPWYADSQNPWPSDPRVASPKVNHNTLGQIWILAGSGGGGGGGGGGYAGATIGKGGDGGNGGGGGASGLVDKNDSRAAYRYEPNYINTMCAGGGGNGGTGGGSTGTKGSEAGLGRDKGGETDQGYENCWTLAGKLGGNGGIGGEEGTSRTSGSASDYSEYTVSYISGADNGTVGTASLSTFTNGTEGQIITLPAYTAKSDYYFQGWKITAYGTVLLSNTGNDLTKATTRLFKQGEQITIPRYCAGNIAFKASVAPKEGLYATSETETITAPFSGSDTYYTYQMTSKVDGTPQNAGNLILSNGVSVSGEDGVYTYVSKGELASSATLGGRPITLEALSDATSTTTVNLETVRVRVDGYTPKGVSLDGGPTLSKPRDATEELFVSGIRLAEDNKGSFPVIVDGETTGISASYGSVAVVTYYTASAKLTLNGFTAGDIGSVYLMDGNRNKIYMTTAADASSTTPVYTATRLPHDAVYTLHVDNINTEKTLDFTDNKEVSYAINRYTTRVNTYLDGQLADIGRVSLDGNGMVKTRAGSYLYINQSNSAMALVVDGETIGNADAGSTTNLYYFTITYKKSGNETGKVPFDKKVYRYGSSVNANATIASQGTLQYAGRTFTGWTITRTNPVDGAATLLSQPMTKGQTLLMDGTMTATATWESADLSAENISVSLSAVSYVYNGQIQIPNVTVTRKYDVLPGSASPASVVLKEGVDYTLSYSNSNTSTDRHTSYGSDGSKNNAIDAGEVTITVHGIGAYTGTCTAKYTIRKAEIEVYGIKAQDKVFDGTTNATLDISDIQLYGVMAGDEGKVSYTAGTAEFATPYADENIRVLVGEDKGTVEYHAPNDPVVNYESGNWLSGDRASDYCVTTTEPVTASIIPKDITDETVTVTLAQETFTYDGTQKKPAVTVTDSTANLYMGEDHKDYTVTYFNNLHAGTATVKIETDTGADSPDSNYTGTITKTFTINPAAITIRAQNAESVYGTLTDVSSYYTVAGIIYDGKETWLDSSGTEKQDSQRDAEELAVSAYTTVKQGYAPGTYNDAVKIRYTPNDDYVVIAHGANYTVKKQPAAEALSVVAKGYTGVYDGDAHSISVTASGYAENEEIKIYYSTDSLIAAQEAATNKTVAALVAPSRTEVGTTTVYYCVVAGNYEGSVTGSKDIVIAAAPLKVTAKAHTITYGSAIGSISESDLSNLTITGFVGSESANDFVSSDGAVTYTSSYKAGDAVGDGYVLTPVLSDAARATDLLKNYDIRYYSGALTVTAKPIESYTWTTLTGSAVSASPYEFTYNGSAQGLKAEPNGIFAGDDVYVGSYETASAVNAGDYMAKVTALGGDDASNYTLDSNAATKSHAYKIKKVTYGSKDGDTDPADIPWKSPINVPDFPVGSPSTPTGVDPYGTAVPEGNFYYVPKDPDVIKQITKNDSATTLNDLIKAIYNQLEELKNADPTQTTELTVTDAISAINSAIEPDPFKPFSQAPDTEVDYIGIGYTPGDANHDPVIGGAEFTVTSTTKTIVHVSAKNVVLTYGDTLGGASIPMTFASDTDVTLTEDENTAITTYLTGKVEYVTSYDTTDASKRGVGTYNIRLRLKGNAPENDTYEFVFESAGTLTVNPKELTLTWPDSNSFVFTGSKIEYKADVTANDLAYTGDEVSVGSYEYEPSANKTSYAESVGSYTAVATSLTGAQAGNYVLTTGDTKSHAWSITKAINEFVTQPSIANWYYGEDAPEPVGSAKFGEVTYEYQQVKEGIADVWFNFKTATKPTQAGTYRLYAYVEGGDNYDRIEKTTKENAPTFTIHPAEVMVTCVDQSTQYGQERTLSYNYQVMKGVVNDSEKTSLNLGNALATNVVVDAARRITSSVGRYVIAHTSVINDDDFDSLTDYDKTYMSEDGNIQITVIAGQYTVTRATLTVSDDPNHSCNVTTTFDGQEHGINPPVLKDSSGNVVDPDTYTVYYSKTPLGASDFGSGSTTSPTYSDANTSAGEVVYYYIVSDNFAPISGSATVRISKKTVTVTANDSTIAYGEAAVNNGATFDGLVEGQTAESLSLSPSYAYYAKNSEGAADTSRPYAPGRANGSKGEYAIVPGGLTHNNYEFTYVNGTMTVTASTGSGGAGDNGGLKPEMFKLPDDFSATYSVNPDGTPVVYAPGVSVSDSYPGADKPYGGSTGHGGTDADFTVTYENNNEAGTAYAVITPTETGNFAGSEPVRIPFTIAKKTVTLTASSDKSSAYNNPITDLTGAYTVTQGNLNEAEKEALKISVTTNATKTSPVGEYVTTVSHKSNDNYEIATVNGTYTITPATLTVTAEPYNGVYDGRVHEAGEVTVKTGKLFTSAKVYYGTSESEAANAAEAGTEEAMSVPNISDAGTYTVYYCAVCDNYESKSGEYTAVITKAHLTVTVDYSGSITYGEAGPDLTGVTLDYTGFKGSDAPDTAFGSSIAAISTNYTAGSNAGTYEVKAAGLTADNYQITYVPGTLTVQPKPVTFTWPETTAITYTGSEISFAATGITGVLEADSVYVSVGAYKEEGSNVFDELIHNYAYKATDEGNYVAEILSLTGSKAGNYTIDNSSNASCKWKIVKEGTSPDPEAVSNYPVIVIKPNDQSIYYGQQAGTFSYTARKYTDTAAYNADTEGTGGEGVTDALATYVTDVSEIRYATSYKVGDNAGTYGIEAYGLTAASGYRIVYKTGTLTVQKATGQAGEGTPNSFTGGAAPDSNNKSDLGMGTGWIYGDTPKTPNAVTSFGGDEGITYTYYVKNQDGSYTELPGIPTTPGEYGVKATASGTDNYVAIDSGYDDYTIGKRPLTIIANDIRSAYGSAIAKLTYSMSGTLADGDSNKVNINLSTTATSTSSVGEYPITVNVDGVSAPYYEVSKTNGTYFITRTAGTLTVTAADYEGIYDGQPHTITVSTSGDNSAVVWYSESELNDNNYASGQRTPISIKNVGTKTVYYYVSSEHSEPVYGSKDIKITERTLTVTAQNQTITYGDPVPTAGAVTYEGFAEGESSATLGLSSTVSYNYYQYDPAATYAIRPTTQSTGNYTFSYVNGTLTVEKKPLTFTWTKNVYTYTGAEQSITATPSGMVNNDKIGVTYTYDQSSGKVNRATMVGTYTATVNGLTGNMAQSYSIDPATSSKEWSIQQGKNAFTESLDMPNWTYGETPSEPAAVSQYGPVRYEYSTSYDGTYTTDAPAVPGSYYVRAVVDGTNDYTGITGAPKRFVINKGSITIYADTLNGKVGDAISLDGKYTIAGSVATGDQVTAVLKTSASGNSSAGSYPVEFEKITVSSRNYTAAKTYSGDSIVDNKISTDSLYDINLVEGNLQLTDAAVTVNTEITGDADYDGTYDGQYHGINVSVNTEDATFTGGKILYSLEKYSDQTSLASAVSAGKASETSPVVKEAGSRTIYYYVTDSEGRILLAGSKTIVINKAPLTIKANDIECYSNSDPVPDGVTCTGFVAGDDISSLSGTLTYTYSYSRGQRAGSYSITPSGLTSGNYDITYEPGILIVKQMKIFGTDEYRPAAKNLVYTGNEQTTTISVGSNVLEKDTDFTVESGDLSATNVGNYTVNIKGLGEYDGTATLTWKITGKPVAAPKAGEGYEMTTNFGEPVTVTVTPKSGYSIWKIDDSGNLVPVAPDGSNPSVTVPDGTPLYVRKDANGNNAASGYTPFIADADPQIAVSVSTEPVNGGTVALKVGDDEVISGKASGRVALSKGRSITLTATPSENFGFTKWTKTDTSGSASDVGTTPEITVQVSANETYTAVFSYQTQTGETVISVPDIISGYDPSNPIEKTYNGTAQDLGLDNTDDYTVSGIGSTSNPATEPGTYELVVTPKEGKVWPDGTTEPRVIKWTIEKETVADKPVVIFNPADDKVIVLGTVDPDGDDSSNTHTGGAPYEYEYQKAGEDTWTPVPDGGFTPDDEGTYYIRVKETGTSKPGPITSVTVGSPITVKTNPATGIEDKNAGLNGYISNVEGVTSYGFRYSTDRRNWNNVNSTMDGTSMSASLTGLSADTTYYYYAYAVKGSKTITGDTLSFITRPTVSEESQSPKGSIGVSVKASDDALAYPFTVTVEYGNDIIASVSGTTGSGTSTATFVGLPDGNYNVVVRRTDGIDYVETKMITISNGKRVNTLFTIVEGENAAIVKVEPGAPKVAVSGLPDIFTSQEVEKAAEGEQSTKVELKVTPVASNVAGALAIKDTVDDDKEVKQFFDLSLYKTTTKLDGAGNETSSRTEDIGSSNTTVLEIAVPYPDVSETTIVMRYHEGKVQEFTKLNARALSSFTDGTYALDLVNKYIFIYSSDFSTYAIADTKTSGGGGGGGGAGGGGGGATPEPADAPVITQPEHGTITVSPASPKSGENATVTVTSEDGYETEDVIVKDKDGNTVPVTKNTDGTYTFTQPSTGPVTIEAIIKQAADLTPTIKKPEHGTISVSPVMPKVGEPAIVTVTPDEGYEIDSVIITDKEGKPVAFILNEDGTYSFVQPASGCVTIEAVLRLKGGVIVRFDLNDKTGTAPDPQTFAKGGKAVRPNDPAAEGYKFTDWYTEKECKNAYDFDAPVNEDLILYAGWEKTGPGPDDKDFGIYFTELFDDPYDGVHYNAEEDRYEIVYTGAPIKPLIRVTSKADGVLKEGIDYSVSYSNNRNYSKKKPATIRVSGRGFYKSKKVLELYILQADLEKAYDKGLIAGADEFKVLNGSKLNPMIVYRGYKLAGRDRDISNKNKITGDTTTDITGKGNFTGALKDVPVKVISRDDQKKGAIKVNLKAGKHVYNGMPQELGVTTAEAVGELTVTAGSSKTPLEEGTDFVVSYSDNISAGRARVTIMGIGACNGTIIKNFTIQPDKMTEINAALSKPDNPVYFNVRGAKPDITVTAHRKAADETVTDVVLTEGKDYKVSYSSNNRVGKGTYTVRFFNNYSGHKSVTGKYDIVPAPIDMAKVEAAQMIYRRPGRYLSKPFVSIDGVQLKTSDYTYKYYLGEEEITSRYKLALADDETSKTVRIVVIGKGNYTNSTAEGTYEVVRRTADAIDLTRAKIVAKDKNKNGRDVAVATQEYTGYEIEPEIRVMARVNRKWVDVDPSLYSVSYINNLNKGSATILVSGNGTETIGSKTARFSINTMRFELFKLIFGTAIHYI